MKKFVMLLAVFLLFSKVYAFDIKILANNKEFNSREITGRDISAMEAWVSTHHLSHEELKLRSQKALEIVMLEEFKVDTSCDIGIARNFLNTSKGLGIIDSENELEHIFILLRTNQFIDDILFNILKNANRVNHQMNLSIHNRPPRRPGNLNNDQTSKVDLEKFYAPVKNWPDDKNKCSIDTYLKMTFDLNWKNVKERDNLISKLNYLALKDEVIDLKTYNRLETLRKMDVLGWPVYFKRYADVINNAKDKLTQSPEAIPANKFSQTYISRKEKITRRDRLYITYDSTQVMIMAQLMEKTSRRMDAIEASLHFRYAGDNGETEIYILSPMEQYRAAIKMLRKELAELMRSDTFKNTGLQYEDLVSAAYETGYIKSEELDYILKFEDFWNPKTPKWKTYANFAYSLAGTATFYLPPPWNIIGAVGLVLSQSKILKKDQDPDEDDNWNVII